MNTLHPSPRSLSRASLLLASSLAIACAPQTDSTEQNDFGPPPNLVLITLDTTRADHLVPYGYFRDTTPEFDKFALESLMFNRCIAPMATTLPTHLSILTGTYPLEHGVMANSTKTGQQYIMSTALTSLAETLRSAGYRTGGFVSGAPLIRGTGAARGYETFGQPTSMDRHSEETVREALEWLAQDPEQPFHLWVHLFDAHWPFLPPEPYQGLYATDAGLEKFIEERSIHFDSLRPLLEMREPSREVTNAYDSALRYQDAQFGRLLDALRARSDWDRTVVVAVGDHGEGLGQHGRAAHGHVWNEQLRVPLLVRFPGKPAGVNNETLSSVDIFPTVLGQLKLPFIHDFQQQTSGKNILGPRFKRSPVFSQETGRSRDLGSYTYALTDNRWKYMRVEKMNGEASEQLFDLAEDPYELTDVSSGRPKITSKFRAGMASLLKQQTARARALHEQGKAQTRPLDEEAQRKLRDLGYVDGDG